MQEGFKKSDIEILVSTMNRSSLDFLIPMFPNHFSGYSILVINQTTSNAIAESNYPNVRVINSFETGLSKSRNLALSKATGKICIITDDDVVFKPQFEEKVVQAFNAFENAALIAFRTEKPDGSLFKKYPSKRITALTDFNMLSIMSVEMVINKTVLKDDIKFDERFGLGAQFTMGEEAIFIYTLKDKGYTIAMEPEFIVQHPEVHSALIQSIKKKYYVQGAFLSRVFKGAYFKWLFLKVFFDLKQGKLKFGEIYTALKAASKGRKDLIETK